LAARRAVSNEYTAAHNRLPLGTLVRVTHLKNGKSVIVRITDRGITDRKVRLDVCKEAAEELGMVTKGVARVRMEIIPDEHGVSPDEVQTAARRL
jgi:rare lipoprotein A